MGHLFPAPSITAGSGGVNAGQALEPFVLQVVGGEAGRRSPGGHALLHGCTRCAPFPGGLRSRLSLYRPPPAGLAAGPSQGAVPAHFPFGVKPTLSGVPDRPRASAGSAWSSCAAQARPVAASEARTPPLPDWGGRVARPSPAAAQAPACGCAEGGLARPDRPAVALLWDAAVPRSSFEVRAARPGYQGRAQRLCRADYGVTTFLLRRQHPIRSRLAISATGSA